MKNFPLFCVWFLFVAHQKLSENETTNQNQVFCCVNQSESSIMLYQPVRFKYHVVSTNQNQVSGCVNN